MAASNSGIKDFASSPGGDSGEFSSSLVISSSLLSTSRQTSEQEAAGTSCPKALWAGSSPAGSWGVSCTNDPEEDHEATDEEEYSEPCKLTSDGDRLLPNLANRYLWVFLPSSLVHKISLAENGWPKTPYTVKIGTDLRVTVSSDKMRRAALSRCTVGSRWDFARSANP